MVHRAIILVCVLCIQFVPSLQQQWKRQFQKRLNYVESKIKSETLKTELDISELRDAIELLNNKTGEEISSSRQDASPIDTDAITGLEVQMKKAVNKHAIRITAISAGLSSEKKYTRQRMKELEKLSEYVASQSIDDIKSDLRKTKVANVKLEEKIQENKEENVELRRLIVEMRLRIDELENSSAAVPVPEPLPPCPDGWFKFQDTCYLYMRNETASWYGAGIRCGDHGGILAEPNTEEKMRYLIAAIGANVWLGATDDHIEGTWQWSSSQTNITFFLWEEGQPNSWRGNQDCLEKGQMLLNDEGCAQEQKYVCEKKANV